VTSANVALTDRQIHSTRPTPVDRDGLMERLRLTLVSTASALLAIPAIIFVVLTVVGWPLVIVSVGIAFIAAAIPGAALLTRAHRALSGPLLGTDIAEQYEDTSGLNVFQRLPIWLRDPARWRNFAFCAFSATGGLALSLVPPVLLLGPLAHLAGLIIDGGTVWIVLVVGVDGPMVALWWILTPVLVKTRATVDRDILDVSRTKRLERRVEEVTASRSETLDHSAAEIRRIERDLHDGPQARIVSLGMNLGLAEQLVAQDPEAAKALLQDARESTVGALEELRSLVRGIHPPVLAERGLPGAIEALTLVVSIPVTLTDTLTGRPPAPVETAVYFGVAECLANAAKHATASRCWVRLSHTDDLLTAVVGDNGRGGADPEGNGLSGVSRRLAAFDGTISVESPDGGPTVVTMEVPCELSLPRTTPSSATD
jgi:signal transduction histidine kinase